MISPVPQPPLDKSFLPAEAVLRSLQHAAKANPECAERLTLTLQGPQNIWRFQIQLPFNDASLKTVCLQTSERLFKTMLWLYGGYHLFVAGPEALTALLNENYNRNGRNAFDSQFMGEKVYNRPLQITPLPSQEHPQPQQHQQSLGGHWSGCRIGFDLGGSDRKLAAVIDGNVIHAEEVVWSPYFEKDPSYHVAGIRDCIERAAQHLPRIDAIGGSSAGILVDNHIQVASLFRGIDPAAFNAHIRSLFIKLQAQYNVPLAVINDGDVTALAGSMTMQKRALLGIAMGTSQAGGYVNIDGNISGALNELAFAPIDWSPTAPSDEWSGDTGVGALYFSQQAIPRLAERAGIALPAEATLPEQLVLIQEMADRDNPQAAKIFATIGDYLAWTLPYYHRFYHNQNVLLLGRVTSGRGGEHIVSRARTSLNIIAPELAKDLAIHVPDERSKRLGQAVAAASLPESKR